MSDNNWMNTPALGGIDPAKLQMLASLAEQAQKKDKSEVMPFLMALSGGGSDDISFNSDETEAIINALKAGKSPQEIKKMDKILSVMKKIKK
ncbi:MAG: hypothetical protein LUI14_00430 [Lachnospiraceae bacterium]|nr:hypothetical protein [Lachnospiraceae bacterium]